MPSKKLTTKGPTTSIVPPDSQAMSGRLLGETCACATSGQAIALPSRMKSRRLMERSLAGAGPGGILSKLLPSRHGKWLCSGVAAKEPTLRDVSNVD
jgi:hypothetical protein